MAYGLQIVGQSVPATWGGRWGDLADTWDDPYFDDADEDEDELSGYGEEIVGRILPGSALRAADLSRIDTKRARKLVKALRKAAPPIKYRVYRVGNQYVAEIPIKLKDGRVLICRGFCSLREAAKDVGYDLEEIAGAIGWPGSAEDFEAALFEMDAWDAPAWGESIVGEVGFDFFKKIGRGIKGAVKSVGKVIKGVAKSKAVKAAVKFTGKVVSNPVVLGAVGVATGGAALPALAAAKGAYDLIDMAKGAGKAADAAKKVIKASSMIADRAAGKKPQPKRPVIKKGPYAGTRLSFFQRQRLDALRKVIAKARAKRKIQPVKIRRTALAPRRVPVRPALPRPSGAAVFRYLVSIQAQR